MRVAAEVAPLLTWRGGRDEVPRLPDYRYVPIPLDLSAAVTMTATIVAELTPRKAQSERSWHEAALLWLVQDTLDDENWHDLAVRSVGPATPKGIIRVSSPLGLRARLGVRVVIGGVAPGFGYALCDEPCGQAYDHDAFRVSNVRFDVAIRTI